MLGSARELRRFGNPIQGTSEQQRSLHGLAQVVRRPGPNVRDRDALAWIFGRCSHANRTVRRGVPFGHGGVEFNLMPIECDFTLWAGPGRVIGPDRIWSRRLT